MNTVPNFGLTIIVFVLISLGIIFIIIYTLLQKMDNLKCPECKKQCIDSHIHIRWIPFKVKYKALCTKCHNYKWFK